jgi:hypothetical protein
MNLRHGDMSETQITCPHCGGEIHLSEALEAQLQARYGAEYQARTEAAIAEARRKAEAERDAISQTLHQELVEQGRKTSEAETQLLELRRKAMQQEEAQQRAIEQTRLETEARLRREAETQLKLRIAEAEKCARAEAALENQSLEARLKEERAKLEVAQQAELTLRQQAEEVETRAREIDLELARRVDVKKTEWEQGLRQSLSAEQELKVKEKEKQIDDMKKVIDDLKRKSEQGSQEMQGEVLEIDIQSALERQFPHDHIRPVPKGMSGADLIQEVRDDAAHPCGNMIWEVKNTKHWQAAWLDKLKADQREAAATIAILVTMALPEGVRGFARINGVWVTDLAHYPMLAVALREQLQQVAFARAAGQGKNEKMEMLYQYLAGDEFRHRVEAIVEAFSSLREQLDKERRAMTRHWAEREKQLERVIMSTTGMYGSLQGIIGKQLPVIPALELDEPELVEGND